MGNIRGISPAGLRQQLLDIESRVGSAPITPTQEKQLFRKLDRVQSSVEKLQGEGNTDFLEDLPEKITRLYGAIHSRAIDAQVEQVVSDAKTLQEKLEGGKDIHQDVSSLKKRLIQIRKRHALGQDNLKIAGYVASRADHYLRGSSLGGEHTPQLLNQFNLLEIQELHYRSEEIDDELATELFEIAEGYYSGQSKDLMKRFQLLPARARDRIRAHYARLGISSPADDRVKAAQAFIATAYDLAAGEDSEPYFSEEELRNLFAESRNA